MLYRFGRFLCACYIKIFLGLDVRGEENIPRSGGFILASNHTSNLDPVVLGVACPVDISFMAKEELFRNRFFGAILNMVNAFPVKRDKADIGAIRQAVRRVKAGHGLLIFPEGGRQTDGSLGAAKEGIGFLALKLNVPVIPAYITGTDKALPAGARQITAQRVAVTFGSKMTFERRMAYHEIAEQVMQAIAKLSNA
jgi:1-acyl-sn-glycerol-3-phosphate acyltransferase